MKIKELIPYLNRLGIKPTNLAAQLHLFRKRGLRPIWEKRFLELSKMMGKTYSELLEELRIPDSRMEFPKVIGGKTFFNQKDLNDQVRNDEWCWNTILKMAKEGKTADRWVLNLCISPTFSVYQKLVTLGLFLKYAEDCIPNQSAYLKSMVSNIYWGFIDQNIENPYEVANLLLPDNISQEIRDSAKECVEKEIACKVSRSEL